MYKRKLLVSLALGILMMTCVFLGIGIFSSRHSGKVTASAAILACSCTVKMPEPHRTEPTCTTPGSVWTTCGNCGLRIGNTQTLAALGHSYEWVIDTAATCTTEGSRHQTCTRCSATGTTETIAATGHVSDMMQHVEEATCTTMGSSYELCTVCGVKFNVKKLQPLGHNYMWVTDKEPTCTEAGSRHQECARCHVSGDSESIAATGHTSDMMQHVEAATCTERGTSYELCTVCEAKLNVKMLPALGHNYEWVVDREATCANSGSRHQECTRCNALGTTETIDKIAHTPTNVQMFQPTCTTPGWKVYFCVECGQECSREQSAEALGHAYEWQIDKEASCSVDGLRHQECTRCHAKMAQETYRDEHVPGIAEPVAPTCTTAGYTIYRCTYCGAVCSRGNTVPALGHVYNIDMPTCTESQMCTRCGMVIKPALGHDTHPCADETCGKCGEMVAATEYHAWGDWQLVRQATATQEGEKTRTCGVCGGTQTQTIPKTSGSGENTGGSGSGGSDKDPGGSDGSAGGGGSGSWTDSLLPGVSDSMKVIIAAGAGVLLFVVGIGIYFAISGKRRKRR